jgi:hypothetical protein
MPPRKVVNLASLAMTSQLDTHTSLMHARRMYRYRYSDWNFSFRVAESSRTNPQTTVAYKYLLRTVDYEYMSAQNTGLYAVRT